MTSDLGRRVAVTLAALLVYRLGTYIPLPGIDVSVWEQIFRNQSGGLMGMVNTFSGGALRRLAIFALNLTPYMAAAPIVQIVCLTWPKLRALNERGDRGRRTIQSYTLGLALLFALFQAWGVASGLEGVKNLVTDPGPLFRLSTAITLTGGTFLLIWISEIITAHGVGNGLALILFSGIVTQIPSSIFAILQLGRQGVLSPALILGLAVLTIVLVGFIVLIEKARRHVLIKYERRQVGGLVIKETVSSLSMKLNGAGIMPLIMTTWLLMVPALLLLTVRLLVLVSHDGPAWLSAIVAVLRPSEIWLMNAIGQLAPGHSAYLVCMAFTVVFFSLLYVAMLIPPDQVTEKLKRYGGVVPGIEAGDATADYIDHVLTRTAVLGGFYLLAVCLIPEILVAFADMPIYLGGVSALVVVCTILDLSEQVKGRTLTTISGRR